MDKAQRKDDELLNNGTGTELVTNTTGDDSSDTKRESTRTYIAQLYVWAFFIVIGAVFLLGLLRGFTAEEYKDMLITVSGVLSGPLGFIVGYYFKASKE